MKELNWWKAVAGVIELSKKFYLVENREFLKLFVINHKKTDLEIVLQIGFFISGCSKGYENSLTFLQTLVIHHVPFHGRKRIGFLYD